MGITALLAILGAITAATQITGAIVSGVNAKNQAEGNRQANELTMAYNSAEAQKNRDWQLMMSSTAHQREVADLKAAGLNPILSANAGSVTAPVGASSSTTAKNTVPDLSDLARVLSSTRDLALIAALTGRKR